MPFILNVKLFELPCCWNVPFKWSCLALTCSILHAQGIYLCSAFIFIFFVTLNVETVGATCSVKLHLTLIVTCWNILLHYTHHIWPKHSWVSLKMNLLLCILCCCYKGRWLLYKEPTCSFGTHAHTLTHQWRSHWEQFGAQCLAQGHLDM